MPEHEAIEALMPSQPLSSATLHTPPLIGLSTNHEIATQDIRLITPAWDSPALYRNPRLSHIWGASPLPTMMYPSHRCCQHAKPPKCLADAESLSETASINQHEITLGSTGIMGGGAMRAAARSYLYDLCAKYAQ